MVCGENSAVVRAVRRDLAGVPCGARRVGEGDATLPLSAPRRLRSAIVLLQVLHSLGAVTRAGPRWPRALLAAKSTLHSATCALAHAPLSQDGGEVIMKVKTNTKFEKVRTGCPSAWVASPSALPLYTCSRDALQRLCQCLPPPHA